MAYLSVEEVRERTSLKEVAELPEEKLQLYLERATAWIHRVAQRKFYDETDLDRLIDLKTASVLLVEYLWVQDHDEGKERVMSQVKQERIGSYAYTLKDDTGKETGLTGIKELDSILLSLMPKTFATGMFFSVSGPSRVGKKCEWS
ncbi:MULTISPECIES: DUF3199 family protein [unclassified Thermoactinomyces]|uniref:DUF3199 family protein n=1 Tax=unclassified Thermoactinomyces TaxID=2634588 RepID=UPI0018DBFAD3|nr:MULTISPECIES: DUF3199 family protein [unclassified Thermoactinomyces]MBH8599075.1 DUF3199 family protein [Thermoactinomyces sp. CICC 10523]MBH8607994.1 DUF3199 family protein [Thermoactinomyces sp. CICC 10521]